jgi:hypothetical protein
VSFATAEDIPVTDRAIDQLVYQLYGLTEAEIKIVEAATAPSSGPIGGEVLGAADPATDTEQVE